MSKNSKKSLGLKFAKSYPYEGFCKDTGERSEVYAVGVREAAETLAWLRYRDTTVIPVNICTFKINGLTWIFNRRSKR